MLQEWHWQTWRNTPANPLAAVDEKGLSRVTLLPTVLIGDLDIAKTAAILVLTNRREVDD